MPVPSPHRPRARAVIAHSQPAGEGGHPAIGWYSTRVGGGAARAGHAADRRWSDAGERRPRRGSTHRRSSSSSRSSTCQRATALFFFFFWPSSGWSIRSARDPPKHRFTIRIIVPTMFGQAPRRLHHGRRVARRTLQRPVSAGGGRISTVHVLVGRGAEPPAF
ncbi:hypothetical protein EVAR_43580_1 [Eumeta japonica]|uniref:Uncharacterized protein n=1 Tax=Eumeta variegata TaxID=151549 RepID=A0A4C1XEN6_EUMVA|nr:hypothetical protein EVAR_43580_1 [Eumeta japonica]